MSVPTLENGKIFDFDLTMSKTHTFANHCIDRYQGQDPSLIYQVGKRLAANLLKSNIPFAHDANHLSAIATFHNNPALIAGVIAHVLGKELQLVETLTSEEPLVAVNVYQVEDEERPFLVSYIPEVGSAFQERMGQLGNKNHQIKFLQRILLQQQQITPSTTFEFYEDTNENYLAAQQLPGMNCHLVGKFNPQFTILQSHSSASPEQEFESNKQKIQQSFCQKLNDLQRRVCKSYAKDSAEYVEGQRLYTTLLNAQTELFTTLSLTAAPGINKAAIEKFSKTCDNNADAANKIMGHGWLYRAGEVLIKALTILFASAGMILGMFGGRGLLSGDDRSYFSNTFFAFNETQGSKSIHQFKEDVKEITNELDGFERNNNPYV